MADKDELDDIVAAVLKNLPVEIYRDAGKPAGKEIGKLGEDMIKAVRLALFPVQIVAAYQDRFENFVNTSIRKVPPERLIPPPAQIIGPVLEGIRYEPSDTPIDQLFSDLLSSSMDKENVDKAHPSYPLIIRQLSSDEAIILKTLHEQKEPAYEFVKTFRFENGRSFDDKIEKDEYPKEVLTFPQNLGFYINHLSQLGLAGIYEYNQTPIYDENTKMQSGSRAFCKYLLTDLGQRFMDACVYKNA